MDCIFCKINSNEIPAFTLYEDENLKVIMDINPNSNGHLLIIPKKHYLDFFELDDKIIIHINKIAKLMANYLIVALKPDGLKVTTNYGINQIIKHYHLHIIPTYKNKQPILDIQETYNKIKNIMK